MRIACSAKLASCSRCWTMLEASTVRHLIFRKLSALVNKVCQHAFMFRHSLADSEIPANALGLMDVDDTASQVAYSSLIQICNRFLLETMNSESDRGQSNTRLLKAEASPPARLIPAPLSQIMGLSVRTTSTCSQCGFRTARDSTTNVLDLVYPRKVGIFQG